MYSPWGCKELNISEQLSFSLYPGLYLLSHCLFFFFFQSLPFDVILLFSFFFFSFFLLNFWLCLGNSQMVLVVRTLLPMQET